MSRRVLSALLALAALCPAGQARAWTEAAVRSVQAQVIVAPDGGAQVTLNATVRVHGGWLEGLELAGLDPDLAIAESVRPWAVDQEGERYEPRVSVVREGRIQIAFPGRSPRRGTVMLGLTYHTSLAHRATEALEGEDRVRVSWTLPGWSSGLDGVQVDVLAPAGSRMAPREAGDSAAAVQTTTHDAGEHTVLSWRRAHLPRTTPWTVRVDVPSDAMVEELRAPPMLVPPPPTSVGSSDADVDPAPFWIGLAAWLGLLVLAKLAAVAALARRARSRARPWLGLPGAMRAALAIAACAGGAWLGMVGQIHLALGALALGSLCAAYRPGTAPPPSRLGAWRAADARWIAAAKRSGWRRWASPSTLVDVTTPLGAAHALAWLAAPWIASAQGGLPVAPEVAWVASLLPFPVLASGTRRAFPLGPAESLRALLSLARRLRSLPDGVGLRPVLHVDVRGEVQDARVRTVLARRPEGLLRLDLVAGQALHAGGWDAQPLLVVVTRADSAAERAIAEALGELPSVESKGGRRVLRQIAIRGRAIPVLDRIVGAIADCPEAPPVSRGTAAPQETVRDLPAPHAVGF